MDDDLLLAVRLQEQYDKESVQCIWQSSRTNHNDDALSRTRDTSIVDPSWELLDPNPDLHALFLQFNDLFFWGKLTGVEVKWSPKMTLCAGVCSYEGKGGLCSIRLSKPLLTFRPRKDLVETLLHEMIHALLFVTHNNRDRESHGPEFLKHMGRINNLTGAKISVYHTFHNEVEEYRKHWWKCNGPCQNRKPYFGYVKRAMNRAPSSHDPWWSDHMKTCGGTFIKIKEPEKSLHTHVKGKSKGPDIRVFTGKGFKLGESSQTIVNKKIPDKKEVTIDVFAGKGYKLGDAKQVDDEVQNDFPSFSESSTLLSKSPINHILNYTTPLANSMMNKASIAKRPKISVANTSAFRNVDGSPVALPFHRKKLNVGLSVHKNNFPNIAQKRPSSEIRTSIQSTLFTPQERKSAGEFQPSKRPRIEVKKNIKDFFQNVSANAVDMPKIHVADANDPESKTITLRQSKVSCPVCQIEVPKDDINYHLDNCLE